MGRLAWTLRRGPRTMRSCVSGPASRPGSSGRRQMRALGRRRSLGGCECRLVDARHLTRRRRRAVSAGDGRGAGCEHRGCDCCQRCRRHSEHEPGSHPAVGQVCKPQRMADAGQRPPNAADRCPRIVWRPLDRVVQRRGILAPEVVRGRRQSTGGIAARGFPLPGSCRGPDRDQLLSRSQPVTREPHDIVVQSSAPAAILRVPIIRFHGACRPFLVIRPESVSRCR
jgi:hypothetical protein